MGGEKCPPTSPVIRRSVIKPTVPNESFYRVDAISVRICARTFAGNAGHASIMVWSPASSRAPESAPLLADLAVFPDKMPVCSTPLGGIKNPRFTRVFLCAKPVSSPFRPVLNARKCVGSCGNEEAVRGVSG